MTSREAVKQIREAADLTQDAFGASIDISGRRVCHVEREGGTFRPAVLVKLCEKYRKEMASLGITPLDFYRSD